MNEKTSFKASLDSFNYAIQFLEAFELLKQNQLKSYIVYHILLVILILKHSHIMITPKHYNKSRNKIPRFKGATWITSIHSNISSKFLKGRTRPNQITISRHNWEAITQEKKTWFTDSNNPSQHGHPVDSRSIPLRSKLILIGNRSRPIHQAKMLAFIGTKRFHLVGTNAQDNTIINISTKRLNIEDTQNIYLPRPRIHSFRTLNSIQIRN